MCQATECPGTGARLAVVLTLESRRRLPGVPVRKARRMPAASGGRGANLRIVSLAYVKPAAVEAARANRRTCENVM